jgi:hypothetical protein
MQRLLGVPRRARSARCRGLRCDGRPHLDAPDGHVHHIGLGSGDGCLVPMPCSVGRRRGAWCRHGLDATCDGGRRDEGTLGRKPIAALGGATSDRRVRQLRRCRGLPFGAARFTGPIIRDGELSAGLRGCALDSTRRVTPHTDAHVVPRGRVWRRRLGRRIRRPVIAARLEARRQPRTGCGGSTARPRGEPGEVAAHAPSLTISRYAVRR